MGTCSKIPLLTAMAISIVGSGTAIAKDDKYTTSNSMRIVGDASDPGRFDILQRAGNGASDYWCAAGEYIVLGRGLSPQTRIFLVQPLSKGRLGRNSIGYSINPDISVPNRTSASMSMKKVGENWTASHGRAQCETGRNRR
jgi:hypothetical protein